MVVIDLFTFGVILAVFINGKTFSVVFFLLPKLFNLKLGVKLIFYNYILFFGAF